MGQILSNILSNNEAGGLAYAHLARLLDAAGDGIFSLDETGLCRYINKAALDLLGYHGENLLGSRLLQRIFDFAADNAMLDEQESSIFQVYSGSGQQGIHVDDEMMVRKDGTLFPVAYSAFPLSPHGDEDGGGVVVVFRDITESKSVVKELSYLATHDTLTGLLNRHTFEKRINQSLQRIRGSSQEAALCYVDLDSFKFVNDSCGHTAGDELLRQLGDVLRSQCRQSDALGRLGGDEFGVLLEDCKLTDAFRIVTKIRRAVNSYRFVWRKNTYNVTLSAGLVALNSHSESVAAALGQADEACYLAKEHGRNRVRIYQGNSDAEAIRRTDQRWLKRISAALENDRFALSGQIIAALNGADGDTEKPAPCVEVLVRMTDDENGLIPPGAFIPIAERYRIMPMIDRWVITHTLSWLLRNPKALDAAQLITINLSALSLSDEGILGDIVEAFTTYAVAPEKIAFEISESAAVASLSRTRAFMTDLKRLGCRVVLDRCGGGLSSVSHLKELPLDLIKFDGHFIRELDNNPVDQVMLDAINRVAHLMGFKTIAFEIENRANLAQLQDLGVDFAQGIGIAEPRLLSEWADDGFSVDENLLLNKVG